MTESFTTLFDDTFKCKNTDLVDLKDCIRLCNPYTYQEYTLTHSYKSSFNTFLCEDLAKNPLHIKIIPCASYEEVKKASKYLSKVSKSCQSNALLEILDNFEILDENKWYFIIVTLTIMSVTLMQLSDFLYNKPKPNQISKDQSMCILLGLIDTIKDVNQDSSCLNCIYPNSVMISKSGNGVYLFTENNYDYCLKISPFSKYSLIEDSRVCLDKFYDNRNCDLWGISLCIYGFIGKCSLQNLPSMNGLEDQNIILNTPLRYQDPALETIFRKLQKGDRSIFNHSYINIWKGLCEIKWDLIEKCEITQLEALHSGLFFKNKVSVDLAIKKLLILGNSSLEVYEYLLKYDLFILFIRKCLNFNWKKSPELLEVFYKILKIKPKDSTFKEKLAELGILDLIYTTISLDPHNQAFYDFVLDYMSENTLTIMQVLYDSGVTMKSLEMSKKILAHKRFISETISYYGPSSIILIQETYKMEIFSTVKLMQALIQVPYYHKAEKLESVFEFIVVVLKKKGNKDEYFDTIKCVIELITEILTLPYFIQNNHLIGKCSSHTEQDIYLSKNPFLYYCYDCTSPLCSACYNYSHRGHNTYSMLYITPHARCNCPDTHTLPSIMPKDFAMPQNKSRLTFMPSNGLNTTESYVNNFKTNYDDLVITTIEPSVSEWSHIGQGVVVYYEVKVIKAGKHENIILGFLGAEVSYHGISGNIIVSGRIVSKGPRFGSYDTVGIGILRNSKVFTTYNGLLSSAMFDCDANQEIKLNVYMCGKGCEIEIKLKGFLFNSFKFGMDALESRSKDHIEEIFKILIKNLKKAKEDRIKEMKLKLKVLFKNIRRNDLIKNLG